MAEKKSSPHVVIVGGGISGLSTARHLIQNGVDPSCIKLLEAKGRIGGRIHGIKINETEKEYLDLGAQFLHGLSGNPILGLSIEKGVISRTESGNDEFNDDTMESEFRLSDGQKIKWRIVEKVWNVVERIFDEADKFARSRVPMSDKDESFGSFVHREFDKYLNTCTKDDANTRHLKELIFDWKMLKEKAESGCKDVFALSLMSWGEYVEYGGDQEFDFSGRYQPLLNALFSDIPKSCIELESQVVMINWMGADGKNETSNIPELSKQVSSLTFHKTKTETHSKRIPSGKVQLKTKDGTIYEADHVVVTCPLGFLKHHAHSMFKPLLPNDKLSVIEHIGFGTVNKMFLEYEQPWWDKNLVGYQFVWDKHQPFVLRCVENEKQGEFLHKDWYRGILGFDAVRTHPNVLEGWVVGDEAVVMETVPEDVVMEICHELLTRFVNCANLPKPKRLIRTRWHSDPHTWGSYSYVKVGHTSYDCEVLARPLMNQGIPRVMFAGEATFPTQIATTQGAFLSGIREADRILQSL